MASAPVIRRVTTDGVAVVTLNRPEARNALNSELLAAIARELTAADEDQGVAAIVLTGTDPAFCAGLDLKELGRPDGALNQGGLEATARASGPWPELRKPLIGAINGPAVTGGLELALHCDFLVASERARFADTHTRVGILPGWGLTVLLPQAIGLRRAKEMSLTGNYLNANEALRLGLVNHVVSHDELVPSARQLAADIAGNDPDAVSTLLASYRRIALTTAAEGLDIERQVGRAWRSRTFDPSEIDRRRAGIVARGHSQIEQA